MRFSCENCHTRYTVSEERVRGKLIRTQCKRCGTRIIVGPIEAPEPDHHRPAERGEASSKNRALFPSSASTDAAEDGEGWFAAIHHEEVGPLNERELRERIENGQITLRTYVWRDGLETWVRVRDVPSLARWVPAEPIPFSTASSPVSLTGRRARILRYAVAAAAVIALVTGAALWSQRQVAPNSPLAVKAVGTAGTAP